VNIRICKEGWKAEAERDGRLTAGEREAFAVHERGCASCFVVRLRFERIAEMLRRLPVDVPSDFVVRATRQRLLANAAGVEN
jgi:hypothetical protein